MTKNDSVENDETAEDEKLLILPLNDKSSKKISQVISNDTARAILGALTDEPLSTSDVAEKLGIPLTTAQYNIEKLMESGLVKVEKTKWSEKFREVKIYAPQKKLVVILPEKTSREEVISALRKYLPMVGFAAVLSGFIEFLSRGFYSLGVVRMTEDAVSKTSASIPEAMEQVAPVPTSISPSPMDALDMTRGVESEAINATSTSEILLGSIENATSQIEEIASNATNITPPSPTAIPETMERIASEIVDISPSPMMIAEETFGSALQTDFFSHIGLWFFLGAVSIIAFIFVIDLYRERRKP
ncbi:MAG: helix-turn-helix domain-containing protein [Halobacteriota archaeon]|nr:helix-turn-helix domain-containing protein [Halobacteriota archaeon]